MASRRGSSVTNVSRPSRPPANRRSRPAPRPPSQSRRKNRNCSVSLPVEIEVSVDVKTLPRHRGGGITEEQCEIDGRIDVTGKSQPINQPLSVLQEILKRQRNILAGLASSGPLSISQKKMKTKDMFKNDERTNNDDDTDLEDEQRSMIEAAKYVEITPKHSISRGQKYEHHNRKTVERHHREHRKRGGGGMRKFTNPSSIVESFNYDMYDDDDEGGYKESDTEIKRKIGHKGDKNNDEYGIPEDIKKAAILKGVQMCERNHHGSQLVELFNRNRRKKGGKATELSKYRKKSVLKIRSQISTIRVVAKSTTEKMNAACQSKDLFSDESKKYIESKEDEQRVRLKGGIDNIGQENLGGKLNEDDQKPKGGRLRGGYEMTIIKNQPVNVQQTITVVATSRLRGGMERTFHHKSPLGKWCKHMTCHCECSSKSKMYKENKSDLLNSFKPSLIRQSTMHMEGYNFNSSGTGAGEKWSKNHTPIQTSKYQSAKLLAAMQTLCKKSTEVSTSESSDGLFIYKKNQRNMKIDTMAKDIGVELQQHYHPMDNFPSHDHRQRATKPPFKRDRKPEVTDGFFNHHRVNDMWKFNHHPTKNVNNKLLKSKSRICNCCIVNRKPSTAPNHRNFGAAITRKSEINVGLINNLENTVEIDYYKNTIKRQSRLHKTKVNTDPLETLQKVNEKLMELSSLTVKPKGVGTGADNDTTTLPLTQYCACYQPNITRIKRRKTRRYYESQRRYKNYDGQRCDGVGGGGDTTESNVESVMKYENHY